MKKNNKNLIYSILLLILLSIGIGYAYLTSNLSITGSTKVTGNTWDIHFANLVVNENSVTATTPASIDPTNNTSINYAITLDKPGDFYEFTVDIVNNGSIPSKINLVTINGITSEVEDIIDYSITYSNNKLVQVNDILNANSSKNIKVKIYFIEDIIPEDLLDTEANLNLTLSIIYNQSNESEFDTNLLIQQLKTENTSCFTKYTGQVTDQVGETVTASNVYFNKCADKRNIIFNNMCWQMIRTTETGGIKMIYNGVVVDGKCESTRGDHKGIISVPANSGVQTLSSSYLYGSSFTYDTTNNTFTLTDTTIATWNDSTYENLLGKFTCKNTEGTCTTLYNVNGYFSNTQAYTSAYTIGDTNYAQIGTSPFNANEYSPAMVGYMFNKVYNYKSIATYTEYVSGNTYAYGNSYTDNGDGTYTIDSATLVTTWPTTSTEYNAIKNKYICKNPTNDTCSDVWYTTSTGNTSFSYYKSSASYKFASSYTYENGTYTLSGESSTFWNIASNDYKTYLNNHHYTCWNDNGICTKISYVYYYDISTSDFIYITDGKSVSDALDEMLLNDNVNRYNSSIKGIVDAWYAGNLNGYTNMLEDTVFCNARNITNLNGWNPSGGSVTSYLQFKNSNNTTNLACESVTDQFAVSNNKAKLTYPVSLLQNEERYNINTPSLMATGVYWWGLSPRHFSAFDSYVRNVDAAGSVGIYYNIVDYVGGVRPVVSLSSGTVISSGTGDEDNPFIISE